MSTAAISAPHTHSRASVIRVMTLVMLALTPATAFGFYAFGWPAIFLFGVTLVSALAFEALCLVIARRPVMQGLMDGSALLTGWLVAMTLPPWAPWWIGLLGGAIAIVLGKHVFGGLGQNLFNPAMVARIMLLVSFPLQMTIWVTPLPLFSDGAPDFGEAAAITFGGASFDAVSGASALGYVATEVGRGVDAMAAQAGAPGLMDLALGFAPGSMGETSALLLLIGGLFLIAFGVTSWRIPVTILATTGALAALFHAIDPATYASASFHLLSGSLIFCAFFIATDYVTSPVTRAGQILFGVGVGAFIYIIRTWASAPEGVGFAVLLMNACTPLIDHYIRPRVFGRDRRGRPLETGE